MSNASPLVNKFMTTRYFSHLTIEGSQVVLQGAEAHHLLHVMRAELGTRVTLFDGNGVEFEGEVQRLGRKQVELSVLARHEIDRELPLSVTLAVSLPKGDRQRWLVEKATEVGVARIVPLVTSYSVAQPVRKTLERLRRTVIEASKQCGRNRLLAIEEPCDWSDFVAKTRSASYRFIAHPKNCLQTDSAQQQTEERLPAESTDGFIAAIGPEGGFSNEEVVLAMEAGWQAIDLGSRILRVETAALVLVAQLVQRLGTS